MASPLQLAVLQRVWALTAAVEVLLMVQAVVKELPIVLVVEELVLLMVLVVHLPQKTPLLGAVVGAVVP